MIFDLANDIVIEPEWDPDRLHSPLSDKLCEPEISSDNIEFEKACELFVDIPWCDITYDGYIDDIIAMALNKADGVRRSQEAVPLAVHSIYRPLCRKEPTTRDDPLSLRKLSGEGTPSERKVVLGWLVDTRAFRIYLPHEKAILWTTEIDELIKSPTRTTSKQLESTIGRLNHVGFILPHARYF